MKTRFTAGPWEIWEEPSEGEPQAVIASENGFIAQTLDGNDLNNARLISAAPDMLEALQRIVHYLQGVPTDFGPGLAINDAQQAINKALGGDTSC